MQSSARMVMRTRTFPVFFVIIIVEKMRVESEVLLILLTEDFFVEKLHFTVFACMVTRIPNFEILYTSLCHYSWWNLKIKYLLALKKKVVLFLLINKKGQPYWYLGFFSYSLSQQLCCWVGICWTDLLWPCYQ